MTQFTYPMTVRPFNWEERTGYLVEFPDLPGCIAKGDTLEEALQKAKEALKAWLAIAKKLGEPIPRPGLARNYSGQWRLRIPKSLHAELAMRAKQEGVSLNTLAATLLAKSLGQKLEAKH